MSSWLGGIISKLSPRKSVSLSNLFEDGTDSSTPVVENIEPEHRTTDYLEVREKRITRAEKIKRKRSLSKTKTPPPSSTPIKRRLSELLLREKSPGRRFLETGLDMLTRNTATSPPTSSEVTPDASDSDSNPAEATEEPYCTWVNDYVSSAELAKKRLFGGETSTTATISTASETSIETYSSQTEIILDEQVTVEVSNASASENIVIEASSSPRDELTTDEEMARVNARKSMPRQAKIAREISPKRKLFPFNFEIKKRKRGPDFTVKEEREIVEFFKVQGGFKNRGGNTVWKKMEERGVCRPRTWQSLKQRFQAFICHDLQHFGVTEDQLLAVDEGTRTETSMTASLLDDHSQLQETSNHDPNDGSTNAAKESDEIFEDASEEVDMSIDYDITAPLQCPATPETSSIKGSAVPGTPVYKCQVLADRQAELLSEIRQLSEGVSLANLALPGTPRKQQITTAVTKQALSWKPKPQEVPAKNKEKEAEKEKEVIPDVFKISKRLPYSTAEEQEIINYLLKYGGFLSKGGNVLWKSMEKSAMVCPGRSWQSLKERFNKTTCNHLHVFGIKKRDLIEGGGENRQAVAVYVQPSENDEASPRKRRRGPPFSRKEENSIVKYFLEKGNYSYRRGNLVWKQMEQSRVCPGRTWQSIKQRFTSFIQKNLYAFDVSEAALMGVPDLIPNVTCEIEMEHEKEKLQASKECTSEAKYRQPYSADEEKEIVAFLLENGGYSSKGGNELWKRMENKGVCKGRTWQSIKARFSKAINTSLEDFDTSEEALYRADKKKPDYNKPWETEKTGSHSKSNIERPEKVQETEKETEVLKEVIDITPQLDVDTQELMNTIFGTEGPLDIEVSVECVEGETSEEPMAEFHIDHNEGEPSELDLLSIELNSESTFLNRVIAKSAPKNKRTRRKSSGSDAGLDISLKEMFSAIEAKKRKSLSQEHPMSPPKKKMRVT